MCVVYTYVYACVVRLCTLHMCVLCYVCVHNYACVLYSQVELVCHASVYINDYREDYGVPSIVNLLDMVKVFKFAVDQGKVAVHCHAGLGEHCLG